MADIGILKRIYLIKARRALPTATSDQRAEFLENLLVNGEATPGEQLTQGGWEITNSNAFGTGAAGKMHATHEERSAALIQAIDEMRGTAPTGCFVPNFQTFRP